MQDRRNPSLKSIDEIGTVELNGVLAEVTARLKDAPLPNTKLWLNNKQTMAFVHLPTPLSWWRRGLARLAGIKVESAPPSDRHHPNHIGGND